MSSKDIRAALLTAKRPLSHDDPQRAANLARYLKGNHPDVPPVLYHGTTGDFHAFNPRHGNIESDLGNGIYATSSKADASANYAGEGPDLTGKIERYVDQNFQDADEEMTPEEMRAAAKEALNVHHQGAMLPVHMALKNPAVLGGPRQTFLDFDEPYDEKTEDYGEPTGKLMDLHHGLTKAADEFDVDHDALQETLGKLHEDAIDNGGLMAKQALRRIKKGMRYQYDPDTGNSASHEIARRAFQHAGYDGFIDNTVNDKFGTNQKGFAGSRVLGMEGVVPGTSHYVAFDPHQVKSAIGNNGQYDPTKPAITEARGGLVERALRAAGGPVLAHDARQKAHSLEAHRADGGPVLYSAAAQAAASMPQPSGPAPQMLATLANRPGVKPDELTAAGSPSSPTVTREQLARHYEDARPEVGEQLNEPTKYGPDERPDLTIPGGTNYREKLLTLPAKKPHVVYDAHTDREHSRHFTWAAAWGAAHEGNQYEGNDLHVEHDRSVPEPYMESHWDDTPNVLAHLRLQDRQLPGGEKALHLEELQSDWGQSARKRGFRDPAAERHHETQIAKHRDHYGAQHGPIIAAYDRTGDTAAYQKARDAVKSAYDQATQPHVDALNKLAEGVPKGPYVDSTQKWTDLGLKHALHEAAAGGYHRLMWTPGQDQADRYDLSKHLGSLKAEPTPTGRVRLHGYHPEHGGLVLDSTVAADELDKHVGKDIAEKIHAGMQAGYQVKNQNSGNVGKVWPTQDEAEAELAGMPESYRSVLSVKRIATHPVTLRGLDLKVGGEGMKGYYDNIIPKRLLALARQHDPSARLEPATAHIPYAPGEEQWEYGQKVAGRDKQFPSLRITPAMRESILKRGFPAYAHGGGVEPQEDLFDMSSLHEVPKTAQFDLPRYAPARGVPQRALDLTADPDVRGRMLETIQSGREKGGERWYNAEPLRHEFTGRLGEDHGNAAFRKYMDLVAATSPRSEVGENVRNASHYFHRHMTGQGMPEVGEKNPQPYGHMAQRLHQLNAQRVAGAGWDPLNNPKPASFVENLTGNHRPVTVDTHALRLPAMLARDPRFLETAYQSNQHAPKQNIQKMVEEGEMPIDRALKSAGYWQAQPKKNEYGHLEQYYQSLAKELGITPAQAQASAWVGGGHLTGLASDESKPFMQFLQDRIHKTAHDTGVDPKDVLDHFIRGKAPLRADGGSVVGRALSLTARR